MIAVFLSCVMSISEKYSGKMAVVVVGLALIASSFLSCYAQDKKPDWKDISVLVYTRNGKGYVHDNIPYAADCIKKLAAQHGFTATVSDDPSLFTPETLQQYSLLIFASTNNDVFDTDEQRLAFRKYIEAGGGFVGIHSVVGTERNWKWFKMMLGGTFAWHPKFQKYQIHVIDGQHPTVAGIPKIWEKEDECYFQKEMYPGIRTIMAHKLTTLNENEKEKILMHAGPYSEFYPAVWHQQFDGGYIWISALGHDKKDYTDPVFIQHIFNGINFIASQVQKPDFTKAYAISKDDAIK